MSGVAEVVEVQAVAGALVEEALLVVEAGAAGLEAEDKLADEFAVEKEEAPGVGTEVRAEEMEA